MKEDQLAQSFPAEALFTDSLKCQGQQMRTLHNCPSPLDRIRTGKRERAAQLGLVELPGCNNSFDANQSYPKANLTKPLQETPSTPKPFRDSLTGLNDVSFTRPLSRGSFSSSLQASGPATNILNCSMDQSLNQSWIFYDYTSAPVSSSEPSFKFTSTYATNPNKAVVTIDARTTEILIVNDMASEMFGLSEEDLIGKRLTQFLKVKRKNQGTLQELDIDPETGNVIKISGRIMEAQHSEGVPLTVSVWTNMLKCDNGGRCLVVMEPVQKVAAHATVTHEGILTSCDENFLRLYGYHSSGDAGLLGCDITKFIPSVKLPSSQTSSDQVETKQTATGITRAGASFPVSLHIDQLLSDDSTPQGCDYNLTLWVFTSISGLVTVSTSGKICAINENFSKFLCGYHSTELTGKPISTILPDLSSYGLPPADLLDSGSIPIPIFEEEERENNSELSFPPTESRAESAFTQERNNAGSNVRCDTGELIQEATQAIQNININDALTSDRCTTAELLAPVELPPLESCLAQSKRPFSDRACSECQLRRESESLEPGEVVDCSLCLSVGDVRVGDQILPDEQQLTSTPSRSSILNDNQRTQSNEFVIQNGCYNGHVQHKDGSLIGVIVQSKRLELSDSSVVNCLWIAQDPEQLGEAARDLLNLTLASSLSQSFTTGQTSFCAQQSPAHEATQKSGDRLANSLLDLDDTLDFPPASGEYRIHYKTTLAVGKGAFGFVKLALRRKDRHECVVKFIKKSKVIKECWMDDEELGRVSLEISLLAKLSHPNIVKLMEVFENEDYFQLVMEKHGSGMDLFEFIEKNPNMDEHLASYIFRQVVEAVSYLHDLSILHRDIKDENIILNEQFAIKLIDFGSSAFLQKGKMFSTFCGTVEYCSPEVLLGNKYRGPEVEIWSMGVTLYTLIFGENPFYDVEETIEAVLKPPFMVSPALMQLIQWMLHPDPLFRARIRDVVKHKWVTQPINIDEYSWSEVLPNYEFKGNTAADNRPDPLNSPTLPRNSSDQRDATEYSEYSDSSVSEDDSEGEVRQEMRKVLSENPD